MAPPAPDDRVAASGRRHQFNKERQPMATELTWRKAIDQVLSEAPGAMRLSEITDKIIQDGLRSNLGAIPQRTVWTVTHTALNNEGDKCPFQKIGRGLFVWKAKAGITQRSSIPAEEPEEEDEVQYGIISAFGMFAEFGGRFQEAMRSNRALWRRATRKVVA
jgi:hypothetical protein